MKIGIFQLLGNSSADPAIVARRVEELGFESYWLGDHTIMPVEISVPYPGVPLGEEPPDYLFHLVDPLMALARAGAVTRTIKLGTAICLVAERNALLLAKQLATLDDHTGGRLILGVGAGWNPEECTVLGGDFPHRWSQVKDHVAAMKVLWTTDISEYHGGYVSFPPVRCYPKPASRPHPPILLGSSGTKTSVRRIVEWGDGWMPSGVENVESYGETVREILALASEVGRDPSEFQFGITAIHSEFRTVEELEAYEEVGAHRAILWLEELELEGILEELAQLAELRERLEARAGRSLGSAERAL
jgi:probable F420-dependent oxidoreductase